MSVMPRFPWPTAAQRALDLADAIKLGAEAEGPAPAVTGLAPRPRAAYDRLVDALNRLPRPLMVLGSLALILSAVVAPDWFSARMEALADMPEALWWLIGAILSLHFGGRYQERAQEFRREVAMPAAPAPRAAETAPAIDPAPATPGPEAETVLATLAPGPNPALAAWRVARP
jgi:hypothetical protein